MIVSLVVGDTDEIFLSAADSESEKTKDRMSEYVGEERKES